MARRNASWLLAGIVALTCWSPLASAQSGPTAPGQSGPSSSPGENLTPSSLPGFLQRMGYQATPVTDRQGRAVTDEDGRPVAYVLERTVELESGPRTFKVYVEITQNKVFLTVELCNLPDLDAVSKEKLNDLMRHQKGASRFAENTEGTKLLLQQCMDNRAMTPQFFQAELERFLEIIRQTEPFWDVSRWKADVPAGGGTPPGPAHPGVDVPPGPPAGSAKKRYQGPASRRVHPAGTSPAARHAVFFVSVSKGSGATA
jgi:hypothetical protein